VDWTILVLYFSFVIGIGVVLERGMKSPTSRFDTRFELRGIVTRLEESTDDPVTSRMRRAARPGPGRT